MKTPTKIKTPILLVDDHHGIYSGKFAYEYLDQYYKDQINKHLSLEDIKSILDGPDNEWYHEAVDNMTNITLKTRSGQKLYMNFYEGGIWLIPACYMQTREYKENWNN